MKNNFYCHCVLFINKFSAASLQPLSTRPPLKVAERVKFTLTFLQQTKRQCSNTRCAMKRNCCKEPSLCHQNERCKPLNSLAKPWKRFTCECKDGYHGNTCEPIRSCQGYANSSQPSDWYKVVNTSAGSLVKVYCHFDSHRAWTLTPLGKSKNSTQCFSVTK